MYEACKESLAQRHATIEASLRSIEESRNNETKSSAGDKHNTARAMMQIEENKAKQQLIETNHIAQELQKIDIEKTTLRCQLGNLVSTTSGDYFISIGVGKIRMEERMYYCVSVNSPIGKLLLGKVKGDKVEFNGRAIEITDIH